MKHLKMLTRLYPYKKYVSFKCSKRENLYITYRFSYQGKSINKIYFSTCNSSKNKDSPLNNET